MENNENKVANNATSENNAANNAASENQSSNEGFFAGLWKRTKKAAPWVIGAGVAGAVGYGAWKCGNKRGFDAGYSACVEDNHETFELARRQREYESRKNGNI